MSKIMKFKIFKIAVFFILFFSFSSAVFAQQDIESAARELKKCSEEMVKG